MVSRSAGSHYRGEGEHELGVSSSTPRVTAPSCWPTKRGGLFSAPRPCRLRWPIPGEGADQDVEQMTRSAERRILEDLSAQGLR